MNTLRSVSRSLALAAGIAAASLSMSAAAAPLTLQFNGYANSPPDFVSLTGIQKSGLVNAGAFNFTITNVSPNEAFVAYCIELEQSLGALVTNYDTTTSAAYFASKSTNQTNLAKLFAGSYADSLTSATKSAAFQLAIWEVVYDTNYSLTPTGSAANPDLSNRIQSNGPNSVVAQATAYLNAIGGTAVNPNLQFTIYQSATNQDFIRVTGGRVPEPATALLLAGLGLAAFSLRRRKQ